MLAVTYPWASASSYLSSQSVADSRCNPHATPRSSKERKKENRQPKGGMGGRYTATTQGGESKERKKTDKGRVATPAQPTHLFPDTLIAAPLSDSVATHIATPSVLSTRRICRAVDLRRHAAAGIRIALALADGRRRLRRRRLPAFR